MDNQFDLIVIGGGSGGLAVAEKAAAYGKRVAVIEKSNLGGTCVNNGCVPKKVMWYAANLAHAVDDATSFGVPAAREKTDWKRLVDGRDNYIEGINQYWDSYVTSSGISRVTGEASFVGPKEVEVDGVQFAADHIVIATGGYPIVPNLPGAEMGITSDEFFALETQPEKVAIIGGGYIGVELAGMLAALGSQVSIVALEDRLLVQFDQMISQVLREEMKKQGIRVITEFQVKALEMIEGAISLRAKGNASLGGFDKVIWAVGRAPNTRNLGLENTGVSVKPNGIIPTDEYQNTNIPGIYAIGDITGRTPLTPVAIAAGRRLADRLFGQSPNARVDYELIPSVVFSHPTVAIIGLTSSQAVQSGKKITEYQTEFVPMRYALSPKGAVTAMKLICAGDDERVVGIHMIGDNVDEIMQGFAVALKMGATKADLDRTIAIHPVSAEELVTMKTPVSITEESGFTQQAA